MNHHINVHVTRDEVGQEMTGSSALDNHKLSGNVCSAVSMNLFDPKSDCRV